MNLIIEKNLSWQKDPILFKYFIQERLIPELHLCLLYKLNDSFQIYKWDNYLKNQFQWALGDYPPNTQNILMQGIANLKYKDCSNYYLIHINQDQIIPGTTAKLYDICEMINSGSLSVPSFPIFKNVFKAFSNTKILKNLIEEFLDDLGLDLEEKT